MSEHITGTAGKQGIGQYVYRDTLFNRGLISFGDEGYIIYSCKLSEGQIRDIGGEKYKALRWIDEQHMPFLG